MTLCPCGHREDDHPAGHCLAALPPVAAAELPAWTCPCRHYAGSKSHRRTAASRRRA